MRKTNKESVNKRFHFRNLLKPLLPFSITALFAVACPVDAPQGLVDAMDEVPEEIPEDLNN